VFHVGAGARAGGIAALESLDGVRELQSGSRGRVEERVAIANRVVRIVHLGGIVVEAMVWLNRVERRDRRIHLL
jgi:hypothetical protein